MARAAIWKGSISFGLLNIPVNLQTADQHKELHFNLLDKKDFARVKFRRVNANTGQEVPYDRIVKGYEYEPEQYVIMGDQDFKAANPEATQAIDILDFVKLGELDPMLFEKPYYLVPQKNGQKGYFLLRDALAKSHKVAIGTIVIRTKQHLAAIMPRGDYLLLEILRFPHEVLEVGEVKYLDEKPAKAAAYRPQELKMAERLIEEMTSKWQPNRYKDTYYSDLMKRIQKKIKSGQAHTIASAEEVPARPAAGGKVADLLPLLRESLAKAPKRRSS